ncbi:MAG: hypothetical protein MHM6MM_003551 [Cercozoa sp. M6MM]
MSQRTPIPPGFEQSSPIVSRSTGFIHRGRRHFVTPRRLVDLSHRNLCFFQFISIYFVQAPTTPSKLSSASRIFNDSTLHDPEDDEVETVALPSPLMSPVLPTRKQAPTTPPRRQRNFARDFCICGALGSHSTIADVILVVEPNSSNPSQRKIAKIRKHRLRGRRECMREAILNCKISGVSTAALGQIKCPSNNPTTPQLQHNGVVRMLETWIERDFLFMLFEWCERGTLKSLLQSQPRPLSEPQIARLFCDIVRGVKTLHSHGWAHMDLCDENVFVTLDGRLLVGDLGEARYALQTPLELGDGHAAYMPPEQIRNIATTHALKIDMFQLGMILFQLATTSCSLPSHGPLWNELRRDTCAVLRNYTTRHGLHRHSDEFYELLRNLTHSDPCDRWSIQQVQQCSFLQIAQAQTPTSPVVLPPIQETRRYEGHFVDGDLLDASTDEVRPVRNAVKPRKLVALFEDV